MSRDGRVGGIVLVVVLLAVALCLPRLATQSAVAASYPPLPSNARSSRLLPPVVVRSSGAHAFRATLPGGVPLTYDPCRPVHYVVNPAGSPPQGVALVRAAADAVSAASGLVLVDDGATSERLAEQRATVQRKRYGRRWAPVLIGWSDEAHYPGLAGEVAGVGGSVSVTPRGPASARLVTGQVALDSAVFDRLAATGRPAQEQAILMHELGHVLGLDHVEDPHELMYPSAGARTDFGPGDLEGLATVGNGVCHTDM